MKNTNQDVNLKINTETVLFFDMDGTLVDTNLANFLSYKKAILTVKKSECNLTYNPDIRFNRNNLKNIVPDLSENEYDSIIQKKEEYYKNFLPETKLNKSIADILLEYSKINKTVLVTNCHEDRAIMTLSHHNLTDKFSNIFYRRLSDGDKKINKFKNAITSLSLSPQTIMAYENEKAEIANAIKAGILIENIIMV